MLSVTGGEQRWPSLVLHLSRSSSQPAGRTDSQPDRRTRTGTQTDTRADTRADRQTGREREMDATCLLVATSRCCRKTNAFLNTADAAPQCPSLDPLNNVSAIEFVWFGAFNLVYYANYHC